MSFSITVFGVDITSALLALGAITGMTYGILAVGLVLVYRSSRVINFAHGEIGAFGAAVCGVLVVRWDVPFWLAFVAALAVSAMVGATTEVAVVRRLRAAPKLMSLVATLGVAQFLMSLSAVVNSASRSGATFPQPPGLPEFKIGVLLVTRAYSGMLVLSPLVVLGLVVFLHRSRFGLAMRASAANSDRARMAGVSVARMSTMAWGLAGAVAAFTTVLIIPTRGFITAETLGPVLLLRALAPAVIARMTSLPIALGAGVAIGLIDQVLIFNYPASGVSDVFLCATIVVALLFQARRGTRDEDNEDWATVQPWGPVPDALNGVWGIRNLGRVVAGLALASAVWVGMISSNSTAVTLVAIAAFALVGLSLGVVTGLAGQLSLGQFALAGVGAAASYAITSRDGNFVVALVAAGLVTGALSMVLGLPALRVRGLLLGVVTLSFALASQRWLLVQNWALGDGVSPARPVLGGLSLERTQRYYFWSLAVLVVGFWLARNVWSGGIGLRLRAVRDNEDGARSFGVTATTVKLQGFALAGVLAGMGGAVYGHLLSRISAQSFDVLSSIQVVALAVLGGIGLLAGPVLGAVYIIGVPRWLPLDNAGLAASALGWLLLILYFPGGIAQLVGIPRQHIIRLLARRAGIDTARIDVPPVRVSANTPPAFPRGSAPSDRTGVLLQAKGLVKNYGGLRAVDHVDLTVTSGEIVGIIGPNGAGKTTLFELLGGFTAADAGCVTFVGEDVTHAPPEQRARQGLIRSFQDAALFPTLTVLETVSLALERTDPTRFIRSTVGFRARDRAKTSTAREYVSLMGLDQFRDKQIRELSTGTRRIAELASVAALGPVVLLLDEPSSGIAQRESEALGGLLLEFREQLGCTIVIIEHDVPLLMALSTRVVAMDTGRVIAVGTPAEVRSNPEVIRSYLGSTTAAIERSQHGTSAPAVDDLRVSRSPEVDPAWIVMAGSIRRRAAR